MAASNQRSDGDGPPVLLEAGSALGEDDVVRVAREGAPAGLGETARDAMELSCERLAALVRTGAPVYGVSTGFGALSTTRVAEERWGELQHSVVRSHAAGLGPPVEREVVRAMILLRARALSAGFSGARPAVVELMLGLLDADIVPVVPEHGSLGASGDLAPLAHVAICLLGEGLVVDSAGVERPAGEALRENGLEPITLAPKEGLSLINGTDGMLGMLVLACADFAGLCKTADVAAAMSAEALLGTDTAFEEAVVGLRPHPGQLASASNLRRLLAGSEIVASHREGDDRVQDAYSIRCAPQVAGAVRDVLAQARAVAAIELGSAVDNPSVLADGRLVSNGNVHGEPLAFAADFLAIASAELGAIAERRIDRLLDLTRSAGLPAFLAEEPGLHSGLMIAQYTAASLVAENRRLAVPASVDSVPTSGMQEDHVSMGWGAARKLRTSLVNLERVLAIELVASTRALALRAPLRPAPATAAVAALVPSRPGPDRVLAPELAETVALVASGGVCEAAEHEVGELL
jgi:histidine ammonia-lyase